MALAFGGNAQVKSDPIWIIAGRSNKRAKKVTYRINGERVSRAYFEMLKGLK